MGCTWSRMRLGLPSGPWVAVIGAALAVAACDPSEPGGMVDGPGAPDGIRPALGPPTLVRRIAFDPCSLVTGGSDTRAECANVEVPLDWNSPGDAKVTFFVKRLVGSASGPHRQLWLLQGGPGGAGDGLEPLAAEIARGDAALDVYIPDHRGTGRSERLDCPQTRGSLSFDYATCLKEYPFTAYAASCAGAELVTT